MAPSLAPRVRPRPVRPGGPGAAWSPEAPSAARRRRGRPRASARVRGPAQHDDREAHQEQGIAAPRAANHTGPFALRSVVGEAVGHRPGRGVAVTRDRAGQLRRGDDGRRVVQRRALGVGSVRGLSRLREARGGTQGRLHATCVRPALRLLEGQGTVDELDHRWRQIGQRCWRRIAPPSWQLLISCS